MVALVFALLSVNDQSSLKDFRLAESADSTPESREARSAQESFEFNRLRLLPATGGTASRCDERIGRYCYWYDSRDTTLPTEPPAIARARGELLAVLDRAFRARPDNDWIAGQHVRYLVEHDSASAAVAAARDCRATHWWCLALLGFALHSNRAYPEADSVYALAARAMPDELFCSWTDWSKLLESKLFDRYKPLDCEHRAALADSVFRVSQPLLSRPGNDFRTELFSRRVMGVLVRGARAPQPWSEDLDEIGLRYGWSVRWSVDDRTYPTLELPPVAGYDRSPSYLFFPTPSTDSTEPRWRWELEPDRPRSRYSPVYLSRITSADRFQIARFPRGDSTIVVAALDLDGEKGLDDRPFGLGLGVLSALDRPPVVVRHDSVRSSTSMSVTVDGDPTVASVEAWGHKSRQAIRARLALDPIDRSAPLVLSDPLLFLPGESLPSGLEEAAARALSSATFSRQRPIGIYWEAGGTQADSVDVSITVVSVRRGLAGRIAQGLSLLKRRAPLTLQWSAPAGRSDRGDVVGRAFELDLRRLKPGRYRLELEAATRSGLKATTEVALELRP